jgi:hypothetical protein
MTDAANPVRHAIRLFVGTGRPLERFTAAVPDARLYALAPGAAFAALPFDTALQDALHVHNGTGDWDDNAGHSLSSNDIAFAAVASRAGPLAFIETDYVGTTGSQSAALFIGGVITFGPLTLDAAQARSRPPTIWPINAALRGLGFKAIAPADEFTSFGLAAWTSNELVHARARPWHGER